MIQHNLGTDLPKSKNQGLYKGITLSVASTSGEVPVSECLEQKTSYHYFIDYQGLIIRALPETSYRAVVDGDPVESIRIGLVFDDHPGEHPEQYNYQVEDSVHKLVDWLKHQYGIDDELVEVLT